MIEFNKIIKISEELENQKRNFLRQNGLFHGGYESIDFLNQKVKCHIDKRDVEIFFEDFSTDFILEGQNENILVVSSWGKAYVFELKNIEFI